MCQTVFCSTREVLHFPATGHPAQGPRGTLVPPENPIQENGDRQAHFIDRRILRLISLIHSSLIVYLALVESTGA